MKSKGVTEEQMAEFFANKHKIRKCPPRDDRFASHTSHYHYGGGPSPMTIANSIENAFRKHLTSTKKRPKGIGPFEGIRGGQGKAIRGLKKKGERKKGNEQD